MGIKLQKLEGRILQGFVKWVKVKHEDFHKSERGSGLRRSTARRWMGFMGWAIEDMVDRIPNKIKTFRVYFFR